MGAVRRQLAEIERTNRALADSPWGPPQAPRGPRAAQWRQVDRRLHFPLAAASPRRRLPFARIVLGLALAAGIAWLLWR